MRMQQYLRQKFALSMTRLTLSAGTLALFFLLGALQLGFLEHAALPLFAILAGALAVAAVLSRATERSCWKLMQQTALLLQRGVDPDTEHFSKETNRVSHSRGLVFVNIPGGPVVFAKEDYLGSSAVRRDGFFPFFLCGIRIRLRDNPPVLLRALTFGRAKRIKAAIDDCFQGNVFLIRNLPRARGD